MNETAGLERAYRRLVACYPKSFRRENGDEILTVLLATAREGQRRPGIAESADLIRGAVRMRLGLSHAPRTVLAAVRLMYLGAVAELCVLVTLLLTEGSIRTAIADRNPQLTASQLGSLTSVFAFDTVLLCIMTAGWLWVGWASGRGHAWARLIATLCFAFYTVAVIVDLGNEMQRYAPACMIADAVAWALGLAAVVLLLMKQSWPYYARH